MAIKVLIGLLVVFNAGLVSAMSSSNYTIPISDCNQGGGGRASGQYRIDDAVGQQKMTGDIKSSNYTLSVGLIPILLPQSGTPISGTPTYAPNNNNVKVYPNPYKKGDAKFGGPGVYFENISAGCIIKIYNIAGELVAEINDPASDKVLWDTNNIASGVYIYTVTGGNGGKSVGKIGIVK
ncbi:MAG: T9SS type A sorting domain-containing protein [bacterium]